MGFGNAAGSFMTGFMAGYKFIDDAEKKQQEINALKAKAEAELRTERENLINIENKRGTELFQEIAKLDNQAEANILKDSPNAAISLSIRNQTENAKAQLIQNFNNVSDSKRILYKDNPALNYINKPVEFRDGGFVSIDSENGSSFIAPRSSDIGQQLRADLLKPKEERAYSVDENGNVFKKDNTGKPIPVMSDGTFVLDPESPLQKQAQLTNIEVLPYKAKEPTGLSLYPKEMITPELKDRLIKAGIKPDENGNFKDLRYSDVENVNKAIINASIFEAKPMYDKTGKAVLATNKDELTKYLSEGYTITNPSVSGADTQTFNALRDDYIKQGMSYIDASKKAFTEVYNIKGTQVIETTTAPIIKAAQVGAKVSEGKPVSKDEALTASATVSKNLTSKQTEAISTFKENMVSYDEFERNYKILQNGIKNGTYKSNIVANIFSQWAKAVPSGNMSIFGNPQELMDKYGIDNNLANSLANVLKIQSGLTVNKEEADRTVNFMIGGLNANEEVKAKAYKNFIESTKFRLTQQAKNIAIYDPYTAQQWLDRDKKQNTPTFSNQTVQAAFDKHGYAPFIVNGNTYIVDKMTGTIKKVKGK